MGLFGPSKKFSQVLTPEEQYHASGAAERTAQDTRHRPRHVRPATAPSSTRKRSRPRRRPGASR
ncbi:hypothetical protein [Streptomyces litmocidini]|uniref:hypothetical protein n=1 Tax=Streptomyces litmocidini TaxID=67318 RepID=UPI0036FFA8D0